MKHLLAALFASVVLCACGGGGDGDGITDQNGVVTLTQGNQTVRLDRSGEYSLEVPSSGNTVTLAANNTLAHANITGSNNMLIVESGVRISVLDVAGANNTVSLGTTVTVGVFSVLGSNATVTISAGDRIDRLYISGSNAQVTIKDTTAVVPLIQLTGTNITVRVPAGYLAKTTVTNSGAGNSVVEP
ncbi:MAG: hypothetical protein V4864_16305 [Pseudomonadota bacterium]